MLAHAAAATATITFLGLAIEAAVGYPAPLFRALRHPVVWIGALIAWLDRRWNRGTRASGAAALLVVLIATAVPTIALTAVLGTSWAGRAILGLVAAALPAQRSLHQHVAGVADALESGVEPARAAVSRIVGRDPQSLDGPAIARAAIESLAENFSDGVVAPAVWGCLFGVPGMALYKAINTADSMVGHRTPRHDRFGWAAARLDDLVNLPASRLAVFWLVLAAAVLPGAEPAEAVRAVRRDAGGHRSPNAGWPEAAMAGALGIRLAGPRRYGGTLVMDGWMGDGRAELTASDIRRALRLYRAACALQLAAVAGLALLLNALS